MGYKCVCRIKKNISVPRDNLNSEVAAPCNQKFYTLAGRQEVDRCRTRRESEESVVRRQESMQARESTVALKPRADATKVQNRGISGPIKKDSCPTKFFKKSFTHYAP